jgi:putative membrane protein
MVIQRNEALAKKLNVYAYILSAIVLALVGVMRRVKIDLGVNFDFLPPIHALLNTCAAVCLIMALVYIRKKDVATHRKFIYAALTCSALFLVCYVLYHFTTEETKYCGEGGMRMVYFIFLITHIVLAGISLPFILLTFIKGYCGMVEEHRKMARLVYPVWLYVAITGPICYLLLYPCYQ